MDESCHHHHHHHHHHQSLNREGRWGTTDDFATSFLHFSIFHRVNPILNNVWMNRVNPILNNVWMNRVNPFLNNVWMNHFK